MPGGTRVRPVGRCYLPSRTDAPAAAPAVLIDRLGRGLRTAAFRGSPGDPEAHQAVPSTLASEKGDQLAWFVPERDQDNEKRLCPQGLQNPSGSFLPKPLSSDAMSGFAHLPETLDSA